jgi:o-succinylbenzoate---CoA ligase
MALLNRDVLSVFAAANAVPDTPAWIFEDRTWTFAELGARVAAAAAWLRDHGVRPGDRVAFRARVAPAPMLALFAIPAASGTAVPIHPRYVAAELRESLEVVAPCRFLGDRELGQMLRASAVKRLPGASRVPPRASGHPWAILFTSGTSGRPRGVILPARVLVASAHASAEVLPFQRRERWLLAMTPAHIGGLSILTRSLLARKTVVAMERFDAREALRVIAAKGVSRISVVPAMLDALLDADTGNRLRRLAAVIIGGAACPRALLERCAARGIHARVTYGMTETCSQVTLQRHDVTHGVEEDSGEPLPGVEVRVVSDADGDGSGRILVRGPIVMSGYVGAKNKGIPAADGWFDTGDCGRWIEDGRLVVLGRGTDMIVTGGENVAPAEVERALEACAGVRQALVFGVPDRRYGQVVAAALVADSTDLDEGFISRKLGERLASFKRPRRLAVVSALPSTAGGKPDRAGAARLFAKELRTWE